MTESKVSVEATVRNIRRKTRRKHTAEEKIRIVLEGLPTFTTNGVKNSWKPGKPDCQETPNVKRDLQKSKIYARKMSS